MHSSGFSYRRSTAPTGASPSPTITAAGKRSRWCPSAPGRHLKRRTLPWSGRPAFGEIAVDHPAARRPPLRVDG
jgi:hypothetical protein